MESLKEIFLITLILLGIAIGISLIVAIIMGTIDTIVNKIKMAKAKKEFEKSVDAFCKALHEEIEKEEAKETKKVSKTKKSK